MTSCIVAAPTVGRVFAHLTNGFQQEQHQDGEQQIEVRLGLSAQHCQEAGFEEPVPLLWAPER